MSGNWEFQYLIFPIFFRETEPVVYSLPGTDRQSKSMGPFFPATEVMRPIGSAHEQKHMTPFHGRMYDSVHKWVRMQTNVCQPKRNI